MHRFRRSAHLDRGSVTAEAALVLPIVAAFALGLVWLISIGLAQVQATDAARDAAREIARGGDQTTATVAARRTAPDLAAVGLERDGDLVTVSVAFPSRPPAWLLVPIPSVDVHASATVAIEDGVAGHGEDGVE